ncbi:DUF4333 domain-containing protein [Lentzea alba]|uniref:DUF4333 domain-containing protein n=1 Tax=Lentzea alba TaxID=2714351 RepID=UPI0039BEE07A
MRSRHLVLVLALGACTSPTTGKPVPAPGTREVFVAKSVERGVVQILEDEYKISGVGVARCPEGQAVEPGTSFDCTVEVGGQVKTVEIRVKTADGEYEVGQPR